MSGPSDTSKTSAIDPMHAKLPKRSETRMDADLRALSTDPAQQLGEADPVSWKYQFSWHVPDFWSYEIPSKTLSDGYLAHGNAADGKEYYNHFFRSTRGRQGPEHVSQGSPGWHDHRSSRNMAENAELAPSISSVSSVFSMRSSIINTTTEPQNPILASQAIKDCAASIVELLVDDYLRSQTPQGSKGRAARKSRKNTESASDSQTSKSPVSNNRGDSDRATSRKRKTLGGDGGNGGESDDESSQDKKQKSFDPEKDKDSRRWACQFAKWRPDHYTCNVRPKEIKDLKGHIFRVHWKEHCDKCLTVYPKGQDAKGHICHPLEAGSIAPPGFITRKRKAEISERESSSLSHEDQWYRLYGVLFPGERRCYNPYVNKSADEHLGRAEGYFRSERAQQIRNQELERSGFDGEIGRRVEEMLDGFLTRLIREYDPNDEESFTPAQRVLQEDDTTQHSQVEAPATETTSPEFVPDSTGDDPILEYAGLCASPDLDQVEDVLGPIEPEDTYFGELFESLLKDGPDLWHNNFEMDGNQTGLVSGT